MMWEEEEDDDGEEDDAVVEVVLFSFFEVALVHVDLKDPRRVRNLRVFLLPGNKLSSDDVDTASAVSVAVTAFSSGEAPAVWAATSFPSAVSVDIWVATAFPSILLVDVWTVDVKRSAVILVLLRGRRC
jgi:hypothetical protein